MNGRAKDDEADLETSPGMVAVDGLAGSRAARPMTELFDIDSQIGGGGNWTCKRLKLVERYWQTRVKVRRGIWGLGPQRHIFTRTFINTAWYRSWAYHQAAEAAKIGKDQ